MGYGITVQVWGERACFSRPEMKGERVSYEMMTPSAARGVLEAIYWKPAIRYVIDAITVLNPIVYEAIRRNEVGGKIPVGSVRQAMNGTPSLLQQTAPADRQQRASLLLRDVAYLIEAHFELVPERCGDDDAPEKHYNMLLRRLRAGQCFQRPYLGCREFPAQFRIVEGERPVSCYAAQESYDLGRMLYDMDYREDACEARFFAASLSHGRLELKGVRA